MEENSSLGFDEILLKNEDGQNRQAAALLAMQERNGSIHVSETDRLLLIQTDQFLYCYNKLSGMFEQVTIDGKEQFDAPMELNIWRAPTDNDRRIKDEWIRAGYDRSHSRAVSYTHLARGRKGGVKYLWKEYESYEIDEKEPVYFGYTSDKEIGEKFMEETVEKYGLTNYHLYPVGGIIGTHVGPACVAISFVKKKKDEK